MFSYLNSKPPADYIGHWSPYYKQLLKWCVTLLMLSYDGDHIRYPDRKHDNISYVVIPNDVAMDDAPPTCDIKRRQSGSIPPAKKTKSAGVCDKAGPTAVPVSW